MPAAARGLQGSEANSLDPFHIVTYLKRVKTSWTYSSSILYQRFPIVHTV